MSRAKSSSVTASACPIGQLKLLLTTSCHACDIPPKNADRETFVGRLLLLLLLLSSSSFPPSGPSLSHQLVSSLPTGPDINTVLSEFQRGLMRSPSLAREISQCHNSSAGCTERSIWMAVTVHFPVDLSFRVRLTRLELARGRLLLRLLLVRGFSTILHS